MKKTDMMKKNKEFRFVYSRGKSVASPYLVLICARNKQGPKVGFSVSSKLGNAVVRNRTKRILRAGFDPLLPLVVQDRSYLVIARRAIVGESSVVAQQQLQFLLREAGMLCEESR